MSKPHWSSNDLHILLECYKNSKGNKNITLEQFNNSPNISAERTTIEHGLKKLKKDLGKLPTFDNKKMFTENINNNNKSGSEDDSDNSQETYRSKKSKKSSRSRRNSVDSHYSRREERSVHSSYSKGSKRNKSRSPIRNNEEDYDSDLDSETRNIAERFNSLGDSNNKSIVVERRYTPPPKEEHVEVKKEEIKFERNVDSLFKQASNQVIGTQEKKEEEKKQELFQLSNYGLAITPQIIDTDFAIYIIFNFNGDTCYIHRVSTDEENNHKLTIELYQAAPTITDISIISPYKDDLLYFNNMKLMQKNTMVNYRSVFEYKFKRRIVISTIKKFQTNKISGIQFEYEKNEYTI